MPRIAVVGAGKFGANHVRTMHELGALAAICDGNQDALAAFADLPENIVRTDNLDVLLADPSLDGVVLATPASSHAALALRVLQAGKACLIEKPMTLTVADADAVLAAAATAGKPVLTGHLLLFQPAVTKMKELIEGGSIGKVRHIACRRSKLGTVRAEEDVLWSFAPHDLSVILHLGDTVSASVTSSSGHRFRDGCEDAWDLRLQLEDGSFAGATASVFVSWMWPVDERLTVVVGDEGMLVYNELQQTLTLRKRRVLPDLAVEDAGDEDIPLEKARFLTLEDQHFLDCIAGRAEPLPSAVNGAAVVRILETASPWEG